MEINTQYQPLEIEKKRYQYWLDNKFFKSIPDGREPYTIVIPPPNVTGVLHMGHMLNNTIQDILVRRARMLGKNACWVPGTDHASIATEAKVVQKLKKKGINKKDISREEFLKHAWEWKEKHGGIILEQLKKLGASCDWDRTSFTMDKSLSGSVIKVFIDLYKKGYIYRGIRMINWDPQAKTAVSDEEVKHKEVQSKLYYVKYKIQNQDEYITIATTRPETILGDTAVCINPKDERFEHLKGKKAIIPLVNRLVPIIEDDYVDMEFGTGALKITPAHDINDYEIGQKHNLESINIFNDDGTLNQNAVLFIGKDRFEVRDLITKELEKSGNLVKIEDYLNKVGYSERTNVAIEPKLSMQWFLKMEELVKPAIENVGNDKIKLYPKKFKNTYNHWLNNIKDWNISRQLWWGHRVPAYFIQSTNDFVIAANKEEALELARIKTSNNSLEITDINQDEDVLDTWFSSWLWPMSVFDGIRYPNNEDIKYYYPTDDLVTGHDIIFFWVARMIIAGYEYKNQYPYKNVYFTGMVRDSFGRKMSKQLGNSPDPIKLMEKYGADGVRIGMLFCSPAGGDLLYDDKLPEQGRNFSNKIWNAFRLVKQMEINRNATQPFYTKVAIDAFDAKLQKVIKTLDKQFELFKISEALMTIYRFFWDEFSSWYLEIIKPPYGEGIDQKTYDTTIMFFEQLLKILHPFMPFITEEIWHLIKERDEKDSIMISDMPKYIDSNEDIIEKYDRAKEIITELRRIRKEKSLPYKEKLNLCVKIDEKKYDNLFNDIIIKLSGLSNIEFIDTKIDKAVSFIVKTVEYFVPLGDLVNTEEELKKLNKDLDYTKGFLMTVLKKLNNERFVNNAPEKVVNMENKKKLEAETKIKALEEQIQNLLT